MAGSSGNLASAFPQAAISPVPPQSDPGTSIPIFAVTSPSAPTATATPTAPFALGWYATDNTSFNASQIDSLPLRPQVINYYSAWNENFNSSFAQAAASAGMTTFVEMEPWHCGPCASGGYPSMTSIAAGAYDAYLTKFGQQIRAFGHPVLATFAHEMNGRWYPWGAGGAEGTTAAQWVAAWDHVVTVVSRAAPGLVGWVWAPNAENSRVHIAPVAAYWPGAQYVDLVGIDGYLRRAQDTYQSVFGQTITDIRALTSLPIWIAETGVAPGPGNTRSAQLAAYAAAVRASGVRGFLYFNQHSWVLSPSEEQSLATAITQP